MLGGVASAVAALYFLGIFERVQNIDAARAALRELGMLAPLLYVVTFSLIQPLFFPAAAIMLTGTVIFSFSELLVYSWIGSIIAAILGFGFARYLGRDFVASRVPERLKRYDQSLELRGLRAVIVFRLLFFISPPATWLLGLSRVRFDKFVIGTAIGLLPGIAGLSWVVSALGMTFVAWLAAQPSQVWGILFAVVLGLILLRIFMSRRQRAARAHSESDDQNRA